MGRKPIGKRPMTAAERQRKSRAERGIGEAGWLPATRPWDGTKARNRHESDAIDRIFVWLEKGDREAVTKWVAYHLAHRRDSRDILKMIALAVPKVRLRSAD